MLPLYSPIPKVAPVKHEPMHGHAPEEFASGSPLSLRGDLSELIVEEQVYDAQTHL